MDKFCEFLVNNWQYLSTAILALLSFILMLIKRKPKKFDEFVTCLSVTLSSIPGFVNAAEEFENDGENRKSYVIAWSFQELEKLLKRELTLDEQAYASKFFSKFIEDVLSTPQKAKCRKED